MGALTMKNWQIISIIVGAVIIAAVAWIYFGGYGNGKASGSCAQEACVEPSCQASANKIENRSILQVNRIDRLYSKSASKFPFVETVTYTHQVPWMKGRSALMSDYARHYKTSTHFISRSINGGEEQGARLMQGDSFNVISSEKNVQFHLVVDLSRCYMHMYAYDADSGERYLLKTYPVAVGTLDADKNSGCATPMGNYKLSNRVGIYKPGHVAKVNGQELELVQVYGTRYIPFGNDYTVCGIQGVPQFMDSKTGQMIESDNFIGQHATSGNISMRANDLEELFSIVTSRSSSIQIVKDFSEAELPGREVDF